MDLDPSVAPAYRAQVNCAVEISAVLEGSRWTYPYSTTLSGFDLIFGGLALAILAPSSRALLHPPTY